MIISKNNTFLIKNKISKKVKFIRVLYAFKVNYNLILNKRFCVYRYYFHKDDNIIWYMNNNNKLVFILFIEKRLYKLLLTELGVYYVLWNIPVNVKTWY